MNSAAWFRGFWRIPLVAFALCAVWVALAGRVVSATPRFELTRVGPRAIDTILTTDAGIPGGVQQTAPHPKSNWHPGQSTVHKLRRGRPVEPTKSLLDLRDRSGLHLSPIVIGWSQPLPSFHSVVAQALLPARAPPSHSTAS